MCSTMMWTVLCNIFCSGVVCDVFYVTVVTGEICDVFYGGKAYYVFYCAVQWCGL